MNVRQTIGMIGFIAGLGIAVSCAQAAPSKPPEPTHMFRVDQTRVVFKFAERGECAPGEFVVVYTDVSNQSAIAGCAHHWNGRDIMLFEDGDLAKLEVEKWSPVGRAL